MNVKYEYYLDGEQMALKSIAEILKLKPKSLSKKVIDYGNRTYSAVIYGRKFEAIRMIKEKK